MKEQKIFLEVSLELQTGFPKEQIPQYPLPQDGWSIRIFLQEWTEIRKMFFLPSAIWIIFPDRDHTAWEITMRLD